MSWGGTWPGDDATTRQFDLNVVRVAFAAVAAAASWFVVANASGAVREFGGQVSFLGSATPYAGSAPSLVAWSLVLTAALVVLPLARERNAKRSLRIGLSAFVTGAAFEVVAGGLALWVSGLSSQYARVILDAGEIENLLRISDALSCLALLAFAVAAYVVRPRCAAGSRSRRRRGSPSRTGSTGR
jgi:hypothetical protein